MQNNKYLNYLDGVIKGCNVFACIMTSVIVALVVYFFDGYNLLTAIKGVEVFQAVATAVVAVIGVGLIIATCIKHVKDENISVTDNMIVTALLLFVFGVIYCIVSNSAGFLELKITAISCLLISALALLYARVRFFKGYQQPEQLKGNATIITYYKTLFKKFWVVAVALLVLSVVAVVYIEKQNILMQTLNNKNLSSIIYVGLGICGAFYLTLMQVRMVEKKINFIDITAIIGFAISVAMLIIAFLLQDKNSRELAFTLSSVIFALTFALSFLLIKNSCVCEDESSAKTSLKFDFKFYVKGLFKQGNLIYCMAVALFLLALVMVLEFTGLIPSLLNKHANGIDATLIIELIIIAMVLTFAFLLCEVKNSTINFADKCLATIAVSSALMLIVINAILGVEFIYEGLFPLVSLLMSLVYIAVRVVVVSSYKVSTKCACEVANKTEEVTCQENKVAQEQTVIEENAVTEEVVIDNGCATEEQVVEEQAQETSEVKKLKRINVKKAFEIYVRTGDEQLKENYSQIKNALLSYGMHARMTKSRENFSKKGLSTSKVKEGKALRLQAKLLVRGKFLKLYLNLDPTNLDAKYFRFKDVSDKMPDQATYIKVRSKLSLKRALELIDLLAKNEGFKLKKKFEPVNYSEVYTDEGLTYMQKLGYDYMVKDTVTLEEVCLYNDEWAEKIVKTKVISNPERYIYDEVTLAELESAFDNGATVSLEAMRQKELIKINANYVTVKESNSLSKKLIVEGNSISPKAVEMIFIAGGEATRLIGE